MTLFSFRKHTATRTTYEPEAPKLPTRTIATTLSPTTAQLAEWLGDVVPISETLATGRVTRTLLDDGWCTTVVYNVHKFGLTSHDVSNISMRIKADLAAM